MRPPFPKAAPARRSRLFSRSMAARSGATSKMPLRRTALMRYGDLAAALQPNAAKAYSESERTTLSASLKLAGRTGLTIPPLKRPRGWLPAREISGRSYVQDAASPPQIRGQDLQRTAPSMSARRWTSIWVAKRCSRNRRDQAAQPRPAIGVGSDALLFLAIILGGAVCPHRLPRRQHGVQQRDARTLHPQVLVSFRRGFHGPRKLAVGVGRAGPAHPGSALKLGRQAPRRPALADRFRAPSEGWRAAHRR